jgi:hypothetical protein
MATLIKQISKLADSSHKPMIGERQAAITAPTAGGTGATAGAFASAVIRDTHTTAINDIITALEAHGLIESND